MNYWGDAGWMTIRSDDLGMVRLEGRDWGDEGGGICMRNEIGEFRKERRGGGL
jgi:hypothetical protein